MTEPRMDEAYGRLVRETEESQRKVAGLESELKRIGAAFVETGNKLQNDPGAVALDHCGVTSTATTTSAVLNPVDLFTRDRLSPSATLPRTI